MSAMVISRKLYQTLEKIKIQPAKHNRNQRKHRLREYPTIEKILFKGRWRRLYWSHGRTFFKFNGHVKFLC